MISKLKYYKRAGWSKQLPQILLLCALLFNATGALLAANNIVNKAQAFANDDAILICTGHEYKWISLSAFEQTGALEFISPPDDAPENAHGIKCTFAYLADSHSDKTLEAIVHSITPPQPKLPPLLPYDSYVKTHQYSLAIARAPPVLS